MVSWALHNTLKSWTLYDLTVDEVQLLVGVMSDNEIKLAKVCQQNATAWSVLSVAQYPDFFIKKNLHTSALAQKYPELSNTEISMQSENTDTEYFVVRPRTKVPRLHKRYDIAVKCFVISANKTMETLSVNLSEGGLQFQETLPEWIAGYFIVGVTTARGTVKLMCSLVEDQKEKKRVQIVSEETDPQYLFYKQWLDTLSQQSES